MKKLLFIILVFAFSFNFVFAQSKQPDIIGVDHTRGPVAEFSDWIVDLSNSIFNIVDQLTSNFKEEIEKRQKIFEEEVKKRKKNLLNQTSEKIKQLIKDFIDSIFEKAEDELLNPNSSKESKT